MLKLSIGYQDSEKFCFSEIVEAYLPAIEEVYFAWKLKNPTRFIRAAMAWILQNFQNLSLWP